MDPDLRGTAALITGGASGIGLAIARALAREGVNLAIASRTPEPKVLEELQDLGVQVHAVPTDVRVEGQVNAMVAQAIEVFGHVDLYVNNAASTWHQPITQVTTEAWMNTINTNLTACLWACREVCRHMVARRRGSILIVGSTAQFNQAHREAAYHITKTGLRSLKNTVALEMAPYGIRVNLLVPGHYPTNLTASLPEEKAVALRREIPLRRFGRADEVGPAAVLLLSDALSPYTTGAELTIDGGLHLRPLPLYSDEDITHMNLG
jgi:3-oxoacyl-[acyl-carrier protein] reductase